jgi:hypothetical protein
MMWEISNGKGPVFLNSLFLSENNLHEAELIGLQYFAPIDQLNTLEHPFSADGYVMDNSLSPDGYLLAERPNKVRLRNLYTGKVVANLEESTQTSLVMTISFSVNNKLLATGSKDATVQLWEIPSGKLLMMLTGHSDYVISTAFSPNGQLLASGSNDLSVHLWNVMTGESVAKLIGYNGGITDVAFSSNERLLATGSTDNKVLLWDVESGKLETSLSGFQDGTERIAFASDDRLLFSESSKGWNKNNRRVRIWETGTYTVLADLPVRASNLEDVRLSADGRQLTWGVGSANVRLWDQSALKDLFSLTVTKVKDTEKVYQLQLQDNLELADPVQPNLYGPISQEIYWPRTHPFHWRNAAERGDVNAMLNLALIYVRADEIRQARFWYERAAETGNANAMVLLGIFYIRCHEIELARTTFLRASEAGAAEGKKLLDAVIRYQEKVIEG